MDPHTEQRLREEVMYLHSLWHQGPPSNPNPIANHNPNRSNLLNRRVNPSQKTGGHISNRGTQLKASKKKMKKKKPKKLRPASEFEWPCPEVTEAPCSSSGWPIFNPAKTKPVRLPTAKEQSLFGAIQLQQNALKISKEFFAGNEDSDGDIDSDDDNDSEDDDTMGEDGNAYYKFFQKLLKEDGELRAYYEKNNENGEFSCLVCGGIGQKVGKRFKNCVSLVQHSLTIAKTKKKKAHRAYSQVICKVLDWDINKLPSMPSLSEKQPDESKVNANLDVSIGNISISNKDKVLNNVDNIELDFKKKDVNNNYIITGITDDVNGDMMLCESSLKVDDTDKCIGNIENGVSNTNENSSRVVSHLSRDVAKMTMLEEIEKNRERIVFN